MIKQFNSYRSQLLFTGLTRDEMMNVETLFSKYSLYYKDSISQVEKLVSYDLLCLTEGDFSKHKNIVLDSNIPFVIIGENKIQSAVGFILRSQFVRHWHDLIKDIVPPVRTPKLEGIEIGVIVRSKTTPIFGRGIVTQVLTSDQVLVKFPTTNLLAKDKAIRCHISQLQILGKIDDLKKEI